MKSYAGMCFLILFSVYFLKLSR